MGTTASPSAAAQYAPANAAIQGAYSNAGGMAAAPKTYQFDPNQANNMASLLSRTQVLNNNAALQERSPQAFAGQESAIKDLTGGVAGDNAFLRNAALKSGLQGAASQGTVGPGSVVSPTSAGGVTAEKIYGSDLLNYRNARDQQAMGVAHAIQPDAAINPADAISLRTQGDMQSIQNQNDYSRYLDNLRLGQVSNLQNQTQQAEGATQANYNANAGAQNANKGAAMGAGAAILAAAASAAVIL